MQPPSEEYVLDASALLALVNGEAGAADVQPLIPHAVISAVNYCEVMRRLRRGGIPPEAIASALSPLLTRRPVPFDETMAELAAEIHDQTRERGLSLGDAACLALAVSLNAPAVTTEVGWEAFGLGVRVIRVG